MGVTCRRCGRDLPGDSPDATRTDCPSCRSDAAAHQGQLTLVTRTADGQARPVSTFQVPPSFLQAYALLEPIGSGACGMVWKATQTSTGRLVAVKFLIQAPHPDATQRFFTEGRALASLRHPNVLTIYDCGLISPHPFLVTELLPGGSLRDRLAKQRRLAVAEACAIAKGCLEGLAACHDLGIVHRDLKPENILFSEDGVPKIADLGVAKVLWSDGALTQTGALIGTPLYMSPEQARGETVGPRSDLYAMGLVLFEVLAGENPFAGGNLAEVVERHLVMVPPNLCDLRPDVPPGLAHLVASALAKAVDDRPPDAATFAAALEDARTVRPGRPPRPSETHPSPAPARRGAASPAAPLTVSFGTSVLAKALVAALAAGVTLALIIVLSIRRPVGVPIAPIASQRPPVPRVWSPPRPLDVS